MNTYKKIFLISYIYFFSYGYIPQVPVDPIKHMMFTAGKSIYELFSLNTLVIGAITVPCYYATRSFDEKIQENFYCHEYKKNIHQLPKWLCTFVHTGFPIFLGALGGFWLTQGLSGNKKLYCAAMGLAPGILLAVLFKNALKSFKHCGNLRPYHEKYAPEKRSYGGCPSGHITLITFTTAYIGENFGWQYSIPLLTFSFLASIEYVNTNRHYASQVVLGAGFGFAVGFAMSKAVEFLYNMCEDKNYKFFVESEYDGSTSLCFECSY